MFVLVFFPSDAAVACFLLFNASACISGCSSGEGGWPVRGDFSKTCMELCYCQMWTSANANVWVRGGKLAVWRVLLSSPYVVLKGFCCGFGA